VAALAIDLGGPLAFGVRGFRVAAGHFAGRFGPIVVIALGESIVAIGAEKNLGHVDEPLETVPAVAVFGASPSVTQRT
jgi:low temperature requirement protein LtrA